MGRAAAARLQAETCGAGVGRRRNGAAWPHDTGAGVLNVSTAAARGKVGPRRGAGAGASATACSLGVQPSPRGGARGAGGEARGEATRKKHVRRRSVRGGATAAVVPPPRRREAAKLVVAVAQKQVVVFHRRGALRCEAKKEAPTLNAAAARAWAEARRDGARKHASPTQSAQTRAQAAKQVRWRGTAAAFGISAGTATSLPAPALPGAFAGGGDAPRRRCRRCWCREAR